eukprot:scaffold2859_cov349-Pavlova_lutheri.AAC.78
MQMMQLGVLQAAKAVQEVSTDLRQPIRQLQARSSRAPLEASRKSLRVKSLPAPNYQAALQMDFPDEQRGRKRTRVARRDGLASLRGAHPNAVLWPSQEMVNKVIARAEETISASEGPAFLKLMLPSHVSGGFWLQLPCDLTRHMPTSSCRFILDCEGEEWENVYLVRGHNSGGLSGGWRGFAIDQGLCVGDAVVFEKAPGHRLIVTIHRASPYGGYTGEAVLGGVLEGETGVEPFKPRRFYVLKKDSDSLDASDTTVDNQPEECVPRKRVLRQRSIANTFAQKKTNVNGKLAKGKNMNEQNKRPARSPDQTTDTEDADGEEYFVECILDERIHENKKYYLIKWQDYDDNWNTWEPEEMLDFPASKYPRRAAINV